MPLIKFNATDIARMRPLDKGWHKFKILSLEEKMNKAQDGMNYTYLMECVESQEDDRNVGKTVEHLFSDKAKGFLVDFIAACLDMTVNAAKDEIENRTKSDEGFELSDFVGCVVWNEITTEIFNDVPQNKSGNRWAAASKTPPF